MNKINNTLMIYVAWVLIMLVGASTALEAYISPRVPSGSASSRRYVKLIKLSKVKGGLDALIKDLHDHQEKLRDWIVYQDLIRLAKDQKLALDKKAEAEKKKAQQVPVYNIQWGSPGAQMLGPVKQRAYAQPPVIPYQQPPVVAPRQYYPQYPQYYQPPVAAPQIVPMQPVPVAVPAAAPPAPVGYYYY